LGGLHENHVACSPLGVSASLDYGKQRRRIEPNRSVLATTEFRLNELVHKLRSLSAMGPLVGPAYLIKRLVEVATRGRMRLHLYHLVAQRVARAPTLPSRRGRSIDVREIGPAEAMRLPVERPPHVLQNRFEHGARCLMASTGGRFLGFLWFQLGAYEEDEVRCLFVPAPRGETAWDFDVYVDPSARLGPAFARLWDEANALFSSLGIAWSISRISAFNTGSLAAHRRFGLERVGSAMFLCAGNVQLMVATARPYVHLAFARHTRPVLRVSARKQSDPASV
jgi:hypothetical protein